MANEQNLIPIELVNARKTREERRESASKAGKASGEARRKRKAMKEQMESLNAGVSASVLMYVLQGKDI